MQIFETNREHETEQAGARFAATLPDGAVVAEEQPHVQGAVAAWVQEGQEELLHVQGQERRS